MSYVFDANTDPNERTRRRRLAEALMLKATDAGPIASPWQGAAKMAQALMGGIELGQYDKQDRLGQESAKADMEAAMNGGGVTARPQVPSPVAAALANPPSFTQTGGKMAQAPSDLAPYFDEASKMTGIPASVLMAKVQQESRFNPNAIGKAGEVGLAQIMPSTARDPGFGMQGVDPQSLRDPRTNILFGAQYLAARGKAAGVTDWNDRNQVAKALTAYNGGGDPNYAQHVMRFMPGQGAPSRVAGALAGGGGQPTMAGGDTLAPPAQGQPTQLPSAAPATGLMGAGQDTSSQQASILKALQNPYISPAQKQVLTLRYQSLQKEAPTYGFQTVGNQVYRTNPKTGAMEPVMQVPQDPTEARLKKAQADKAERDLQQGNPDLEIIKDRNGNPIASFNKRTGERKPFTDLPAPDEMFNGNGEGAQALNFLVKQGRLTKEQAAMMAAGKFTTQADGSLLFVTPDAIFPNATAAPKQPTEPPPPGATVPQTTKPGTETQGVRTITAPRPDKPLTESESKIFQFTRRADAAAKTLQGLETEGTRSISRFFDTKVPGGNYLVGEDFQKFAQAKREFINALLRRESGAVIGKEEEDNFDKQYMPMPGDAKSVIEQKRVARMRAIQAMKEELGGKYKEPGPGEETAAPTNDPAALKKKYGLD